MSAIDDVIKSGTIERICKALAGNFSDDLQQELYLTFCEMPEHKLQKLLDTNFDGYVFICVCHAMHNKSKFKRKHDPYREFATDVLPDVFMEENITSTVELNRVKDFIDGMRWYDRDLFWEYIDEGSLRKIEEKIGIPYSSVYVTVKTVRERLDERFNENTDSNRRSD